MTTPHSPSMPARFGDAHHLPKSGQTRRPTTPTTGAEAQSRSDEPASVSSKLGYKATFDAPPVKNLPAATGADACPLTIDIGLPSEALNPLPRRRR
jgi:hypothetical protein